MVARGNLGARRGNLVRTCAHLTHQRRQALLHVRERSREHTHFIAPLGHLHTCGQVSSSNGLRQNHGLTHRLGNAAHEHQRQQERHPDANHQQRTHAIRQTTGLRSTLLEHPRELPHRIGIEGIQAVNGLGEGVKVHLRRDACLLRLDHFFLRQLQCRCSHLTLLPGWRFQ
jgi:hypothetical protein